VVLVRIAEKGGESFQLSVFSSRFCGWDGLDSRFHLPGMTGKGESSGQSHSP